MHMKLEELIRAVQLARTSLVQMEELSDEELELLQKEFQTFRDDATAKLGLIEQNAPPERLITNLSEEIIAFLRRHRESHCDRYVWMSALGGLC